MALEVTVFATVATFGCEEGWTDNFAIRTWAIFQKVTRVLLFSLASIEADFAESLLLRATIAPLLFAIGTTSLDSECKRSHDKVRLRRVSLNDLKFDCVRLVVIPITICGKKFSIFLLTI